MGISSQLHLRTFFICSLSPPVQGVPREGPDCRLPLEAECFGPDPWGNFHFHFKFDLEYSWVMVLEGLTGS